MTELMAWSIEASVAGEWHKLDQSIGARDEIMRAAEGLLKRVPSLDAVRVVGCDFFAQRRQWVASGPEMVLRRGGEWE